MIRNRRRAWQQVLSKSHRSNLTPGGPHRKNAPLGASDAVSERPETVLVQSLYDNLFGSKKHTVSTQTAAKLILRFAPGNAENLTISDISTPPLHSHSTFIDAKTVTTAVSVIHQRIKQRNLD